MTNTRKLWLLIIMQLLTLPSWAGHGKKLAWLQIVSEEQSSVTGEVDIHLILKMYDSAIVIRGVSAKLPAGWNVVQSPSMDTFYAKGDSIAFTISLQHPANLPFYPVKIPLGLRLASTQDSIPVYDSVRVPCHFYFTPYTAALRNFSTLCF